MSVTTVAAVDIGASSGRVMLGHVGPDELRLQQVSRFPTGAVTMHDELHVDVAAIYRAVTEGLREAASVAGQGDTGGSVSVGSIGGASESSDGSGSNPSSSASSGRGGGTQRGHIASIGIDTWAVDYGLMRGGELLAPPFHYRDGRTDAAVQRVHAATPFAELHAANGLQFLSFNTLYQLEADRESGGLDLADGMLLLPDLVAYWLTGEAAAEVTNASTTGLLRPDGSGWNAELIARLGLPRSILAPLVRPGETIGTVAGAAADTTRLGGTPVTAVGSHDTASAVVGVPMTDPDAAYISCGTWGLVGVELEHPVITDAAREANFTNEGGVDGRVRFLHNVMGLWLLSESVRTWEAESGASIDLPALLSAASAVTDAVPIFDANDARFMPPGDMPQRIAAWLREHDKPVPTSRAAMVRCIIESLADAFADAVQTASALSGKRVNVIHIVGGGSQNELLCRLTAERAGLPVLAGPVEATALGNVLVQARARGAVTGSLESLRDLVARTTSPRRFAP
ncbi:rhamnulokinase family protein [Microbacterium sp. MPKO10]|uniref:rhamnulokinase n=1 Tax=Microbacterium sp. MPKO10 TaxID=2989818 RepID=UPI002235DFBE|nr:rhamnulokinase family protein [Microbacterium sp. MPKO10]MCW4456850.1 rhamnulokinase [Microbacterium sp. MPKO10]